MSGVLQTIKLRRLPSVRLAINISICFVMMMNEMCTVYISKSVLAPVAYSRPQSLTELLSKSRDPTPTCTLWNNHVVVGRHQFAKVFILSPTADRFAVVYKHGQDKNKRAPMVFIIREKKRNR